MTPTELKQARQSLGLTQLQLAEWMGVSDRTVKHWEAGSRNADATAVLLLKAYLDGYRQPVERTKHKQGISDSPV